MLLLLLPSDFLRLTAVQQKHGTNSLKESLMRYDDVHLLQPYLTINICTHLITHIT